MSLEIIFLVKKQSELEKKLRRIEAVHNVLKEKEQKESLTSRQKNMLRNDEGYLKNISKHLKSLKKQKKKKKKKKKKKWSRLFI